FSEGWHQSPLIGGKRQVCVLRTQIFTESRWSSPRYPSPVHFRVRVIDDDGYAGAWSPAQTVFPEPEPWYLFGIPAIAIILLAL
ncbi:hypothetical protein, partial [Thiolapillus sp.]